MARDDLRHGAWLLPVPWGLAWGQPSALSPPPCASPCRIKHPNIVALDDIYESGTHLYLIMQL